MGFILLGTLPWMMPGWVSEVPANMVFSKFGFIDAAGREVIPLKFQHGFSFSQGLAPVKQGEQWRYIDPQGKKVIQLPIVVTEARPFAEDLAPVRVGQK
jgi:hypothetical protein